MTTLRILLCYEDTDAKFATQLLTDLRATGAEVITNRVGVVSCGDADGVVPCADPTPTDLDDTASEQFLSEELSQCQQLIVVQTPEALQSLRIRAIVDAAFRYLQAGQMTGVLRVIAHPLNAAEVQDMPPMWAMIPEFDASLDYPRALVKLRLHLGLSDTNELPGAPPPASHMSSIGPLVLTMIRNKFSNLFHAQRPTIKDRPLHPLKYPLDLKGIRNKFSAADSSHAQWFAAKDRLPRLNRYLYVARRSQYILLLLAIALILGITSVTILLHQSSIRAQSNPDAHPARIHTPIPTTHATTQASSTQASTPTATQTPSTQASTPTATQASSTQAPTPTATRVSPTQAPTPTPSTAPSFRPSGSYSKWWATTFCCATGYMGSKQVGTLYAGTNYMFCKVWGAEVRDSSGQYNHWWLWTDLDTGGQGWVSAYYLKNWGNDVAKDDSGNVIPNC